MAPRAFEVAFLTFSPRLYILRVLTISSLLIISVNIQGILDWTDWSYSLLNVNPALWIALYASIAVHQIISICRWPILYGVIDLPVLIVEVIGAGYDAINVPLGSWVPETFVFHGVLVWIVVGTLSVTICFRIFEVVYSKGRSLMRPLDILAYQSKFSGADTLDKGWKSTFYMLLGRSIWNKNFVGETVHIRAIRGILAIVVLLAIFFYTLLNVIFWPIKEAALSPVKEYRIAGDEPFDLLKKTINPGWRVTYALAEQQSATTTNPNSLISEELFFSAVKVTAIWSDYLNKTETELPECQQSSVGSGDDSYYSYHCPSKMDAPDWFLPDLNINVDFSQLAIGLSGMVQYSARTQLPLVIGLSNDVFIDAIYKVPLTIIPGVNMAASYTIRIRQVYANGILAALGMFEASKAFFVPQIVTLYPDPTATFVGSNQSSLNVFYQDDYSEVTFIQDFRDKSVLAGFSSVGGLWTSFSGVFALLFGASMLHIFYGSKPLSIFGLAHTFHAGEMKKDCIARYPQILKENDSPEQRGLLSLLRDHLINLDFLDEKTDDQNSAELRDRDEDGELRGHTGAYSAIEMTETDELRRIVSK